jgi:hypothetical protein
MPKPLKCLLLVWPCQRPTGSVIGILTYMSIHDQIKELERPGKLYCLESLLTGEETVRTLWVSSDVLAAVTPPYPLGSNPQQRERLREFREFLDAFLEHGHISVAQNPDDKPEFAMLARVKPPERDFWDFRVTAPQPGIRAFGAFADFNTFVVLTWDFRENIPPGQFDAEVADCMDAWRDLFGDTPPYAKSSLNEYLTEYTEYPDA